MQTPEQRVASNQRYYSKNREKVLGLNRQNKQRNAQHLAQVKQQRGCQTCGYNKCAAALDFHHLGSKSFELSRAATMGMSIQSLDDEIAKCIVLCANCHRELHAP